ncbi:hypothetical protein [Moheibacter lacus]|uniref:Uncharacterized protein n=1 Tax=Moheibacter lacus TaxID=2745851 RepID=A0A838ZG01_9FLAO|nr:hypothetical protein [Moheibacter lacus]MBA5628188.1 hypothetical protein [Moheibacter lacus]
MEHQKLDFDDKKVVNSQPQLIAEGFSSVETKLGLTNKFYYFKTSEKAEEEKILFSDLKRIERKEYLPGSKESHWVVYEKLKLIIFDNHLEKDLEVPEFFAPVRFTNGKINVFSFIESTCKSKNYSSCNISGLHFYFKPTDKNEGIKPTNFTFGNFFTISKLTEKYYLSFKLLGEDCPAFQKFVEQHESQNKANFQPDFVKLVKKIYYKELTETYKDDYKDQLKTAKKELKDDAYDQFEGELYQKYLNDSSELFYNELFDEMIVNYINSCE